MAEDSGRLTGDLGDIAAGPQRRCEMQTACCEVKTKTTRLRRSIRLRIATMSPAVLGRLPPFSTIAVFGVAVVDITWAHTLFGIVFAGVYLRLRKQPA